MPRPTAAPDVCARCVRAWLLVVDYFKTTLGYPAHWLGEVIDEIFTGKLRGALQLVRETPAGRSPLTVANIAAASTQPVLDELLTLLRVMSPSLQLPIARPLPRALAWVTVPFVEERLRLHVDYHINDPSLQAGGDQDVSLLLMNTAAGRLAPVYEDLMRARPTPASQIFGLSRLIDAVQKCAISEDLQATATYFQLISSCRVTSKGPFAVSFALPAETARRLTATRDITCIAVHLHSAAAMCSPLRAPYWIVKY
eukprot:m.248872 g.248872  ORF g.248872 m.248872 type:complete len:255 (+) comp15863_c0_seq1:2143-2907(+)